MQMVVLRQIGTINKECSAAGKAAHDERGQEMQTAQEKSARSTALKCRRQTNKNAERLARTGTRKTKTKRTETGCHMANTHDKKRET